MDNCCSIRVGFLCVFISFILSRILASDNNNNKEYCLIKSEQEFVMFQYTNEIVLSEVCQIITSNDNSLPDIFSGQYFDNVNNNFVFVDNSKGCVFDVSAATNSINNYYTFSINFHLSSIIYYNYLYFIGDETQGKYINCVFSSDQISKQDDFPHSGNILNHNIDCTNFDNIILCALVFGGDNKLKFHSYQIQDDSSILSIDYRPEASQITNENESCIYPYTSDSFQKIRIKKIRDTIFIVCTAINTDIFCNIGNRKDNNTYIKLYPSLNHKFKVLSFTKEFSIRVVNRNTVVILSEDSSNNSFYFTMLEIDDNYDVSYLLPQTELKHNTNSFHPFILDAQTIGTITSTNDSLFEVKMLKSKFCINTPIDISLYPRTSRTINIADYLGYQIDNTYIKFTFQNSNDIELSYGNDNNIISNKTSYLYNSNMQYKYNAISTAENCTITYHFGFSNSKDSPVIYCNKINFNILTCEENCARCISSDKGNCIECKENKYVSGNEGDSTFECKDTPQEVCFFNGKIRKCDSSCKTCKDNKFNCIDCADNYVECKSNECINCTINDNFKYKCIAKDLLISNCYFDTNEYKKCHELCLKCKGPSNDTSHNCIECKNDYYPTEDANGNCFQSKETVPGYYYDETKNIFMKCHPACKGCSGRDVTEQYTLCTKELGCANTFYPLESDRSQCLQGKIEHYFFSETAKQYLACHNSCLTCDDGGESDCTSCNEGYAHINQTSSNTDSFTCYKNDSNVEEYFYYKEENVFVKCGSNCKTCTMNPNESTGSLLICTECQPNFIQIEHQSKCTLVQEDGMKGYYYDDKENMYIQCNKACVECTGKENTQCKAGGCSDLHFPLSTTPTTCYSKSEGEQLGYIFYEDKFLQCHQACNTCNDKGTSDLDTKCLECASGFIKVKDKEELCLSESNPPSNTIRINDDGVDKFAFCDDKCGSCQDDVSNCVTCGENYRQIDLNNDKLTCINETEKNQNYPNYYLSSLQIYKQCDTPCASCETMPHVCTACNNKDGYYQLIQNEHSNINNVVTCKDDSILEEGYYLDKDNNDQKGYKRCYASCSMCDGPGDEVNHNCKEHKCIEGYITHPYNTTQCIIPCNYYYYINTNNINIITCTVNKACPNDYPFLIVSKNECVERCDDEVYYTLNNNQCVDECPEDTTTDEATKACTPLDLCKKTEYQTTLTASTIADTIDTLASNYMSAFSYTDKHVNILSHVGGDYQIVIYKSKECAKEFITELSTMELECLPKDIPLTTLQMTQQRDNGPDQLSYAFYNSLTNERIDMSICEGEKIEVDVSISNSGSNITQAIEFDKLGIDVYDINHPFFNDICFTYTADNGRDVPLSERKKHYYQDVTFCEEGCELKQINLQTENATCECDVQTDFVSELLDNPLTGEIMNLLRNANFEVMKCYKGVFDVRNMSTNIGGWVITVLCVPQLVFVIIYIKHGLMGIRIYLLQFMGTNPPRKRLQANILTSLPNINDNNNANENDKHDEDVQKQKISLMVVNRNPENEIFNESSTINEDTNSMNCISKDGLQQRNSMSITPLEKIKTQKECLYEYTNTNTNCDSSKKLRNTKTYKEDDEVCNTQIHNNDNVKYNFDVFQQRRTLALETQKNEFSDSELNGLDLYDAVIFDKRTFCQIYWNQLKNKEGIINAFFDHDELELIPIKAICFFLSASLYFTLNALFYFEDVISAEYNHKGPMTFGYIFTNEIDRIMYSMLIGSVIDLILPCLTDTKGRIKSLIRRENDNEKFRDESIRIVKVLKTKILIFLIFNTLLMCFCWYYLSSFCYCYHNTQINWLIGGFITWLFCLILPFIYCFIIALLRYLGLKYKMELAYKLSSCLSD